MKTFDILCSVCLTQHHDYVIYDSQCVAVRCRSTGEWLDEHHAIDERIALVPTGSTTRSTTRLSRWDLVIHTFGMQIHVGPVLAVSKADAAIKARLEHLSSRGQRVLRSGGCAFGLSEPG